MYKDQRLETSYQAHPEKIDFVVQVFSLIFSLHYVKLLHFLFDLRSIRKNVTTKNCQYTSQLFLKIYTAHKTSSNLYWGLVLIIK